MAFTKNNTNGTNNKERVYLDIDALNWDVANVRVLSDYVVSFTLKLAGLSLYGMKLLESKKDGKRFIFAGQSKGKDDKYYDNYAIYLKDADKEAIIAAVTAQLED